MADHGPPHPDRGARLDRHSTFGSQVSPRGYAVWAWSDRWAVKGGVARGYRAPALEEFEDGIIGLGNNGRDPLFGNADLRPELGTNWEAGVEMDQGSGLSASLAVFRTELTDRIERPVAATGGQTASIGEALLKGLELSVRSHFGDHWSVRADYTYTHSEVTNGAAAGLNEGDPLMDLGASWRMNERFTVNATVENLLDQSFVDYRPYAPRNNSDVTAFSNVYNNILEPRRLALTVRASF